MEPKRAVPGVCSGSSFCKWPALGGTWLQLVQLPTAYLGSLEPRMHFAALMQRMEKKTEVSKIGARPDAMARAAKKTHAAGFSG